MEICYLEDFIELVRCASFTDAARRVGVSQSALSKRIKAMEADLGVVLADIVTVREIQPHAVRPCGVGGPSREQEPVPGR